MGISVDGRCICNNKVAFSNLSSIEWTRPESKAQAKQRNPSQKCITSRNGQTR